MRSRDVLSSDEKFGASLLAAGRRERPDPRARRAAIIAVAGASTGIGAAHASAAVGESARLVTKLFTGSSFTTLLAKTAAITSLVMAPLAPPDPHVVEPIPRAAVRRTIAAAAPQPQVALQPRASLQPPETPPSEAPPPSAPVAGRAAPLAARSPQRVGQPPDASPAAPPVAAVAMSRDDALLREVERLEATRRAIDAGDLTGATRLLDQDATSDTLGPEAQVLAIELAVRGGHADTARRLANTFLAAHGASPLAARVRRLVGALP